MKKAAPSKSQKRRVTWMLACFRMQDVAETNRDPVADEMQRLEQLQMKLLEEIQILQDKETLLELKNVELLHQLKETQVEKDQLILKIEAARGGKPWDEIDDMDNKDEICEDLGSVGEVESSNASIVGEDKEKGMEHSSLQERLKDLDMQLQQKEAEMKQLEAQNGELQVENRHLNEVLSDRNKETSYFKSMISQLKMEKDGLIGNITSLEAKIHNDLERRLVTLTKERDSLMCTNENLSLKIDEAENLRKNSDHMISQLKMEKDNLMANIAALEAKMHDVSGLSNDGVESENDGAESENDGTESEDDGAKSENEEETFENVVHDYSYGLDFIKNLGYDLPLPICSCTGEVRKCGRRGKGGWLSTCCTATMSIYPLPKGPKKKKRRIQGRKMCGDVFRKHLINLHGENYNFEVAIDLKELWNKLGSNQHASKK